MASPTRTEPQRTPADQRPSAAFGVKPPTDHPVDVALLYVAGGAALAAGTPVLDRWPRGRTPSWSHVDPSVAQALTTGLTSSLLFANSAAFRVYVWPVQMSAQPLSDRQQPARRKALFGQPSREPPVLVEPTA